MKLYRDLKDGHAEMALVILAVAGAVGLFVTIGLCVSLIAFLARAGG